MIPIAPLLTLVDIASLCVAHALSTQHQCTCYEICEIHQKNQTLRNVPSGTFLGRHTALWLLHVDKSRQTTPMSIAFLGGASKRQRGSERYPVRPRQEARASPAHIKCKIYVECIVWHLWQLFNTKFMFVMLTKKQSANHPVICIANDKGRSPLATNHF